MKNSLKERTRIQHGVIKEEYRTPQMEIIAFETEDIITASGGKYCAVLFLLTNHSMNGIGRWHR